MLLVILCRDSSKCKRYICSPCTRDRWLNYVNAPQMEGTFDQSLSCKSDSREVGLRNLAYPMIMWRSPHRNQTCESCLSQACQPFSHCTFTFTLFCLDVCDFDSLTQGSGYEAWSMSQNLISKDTYYRTSMVTKGLQKSNESEIMKNKINKI